MNESLSTPVLFLVFNRPDTTRQVFEAIRKAKPQKLYIAADGPREGRAGEAERCAETRAIVDNIDWPCEKKTLFREQNIGCRNAVSSAIDWFFSNEEEGIILEDDCLPSASFFTYCTELLELYRHDDRIMHICGDNPTDGTVYGASSYYFSPFGLIWGWASWRRAWQKYDLGMSSFPAFKEQKQIQNVFHQKTYQNYWLEKYQDIYDAKIDTWDYQWLYTIMCEGGLAIVPNVNLIQNIGFGADATHTTFESHLSNKTTGEIVDLVHPQFKLINGDAIRFTMEYYYNTPEKIGFLESFLLYRIARSIYGSIRNALGLNG